MFECDQRMSSSDGGYILSKLTVGLEITLEVLLHLYTLTCQIDVWYSVANVMVDTWRCVIGLVTFQDTRRDQLCCFHQKREWAVSSYSTCCAHVRLQIRLTHSFGITGQYMHYKHFGAPKFRFIPIVGVSGNIKVKKCITLDELFSCGDVYVHSMVRTI